MKRIGALVALLLVLAFAGPSLGAAFGSRSATLQWDYDYVKNPPCKDGTPPAPGKGCVIGFNVFLGKPVRRSDQRFIPNAFDQSGHITDKKISLTIPLHRHGNMQFCVVAVAKYLNGQTLESSPLCLTRRVLPSGIGKR